VERNEELTRADRRGDGAPTRGLASDRSGAFPLRLALALFAASLVALSLATLGTMLTLALVPLLLAVAIAVELLAARRRKGANGQFLSLADRLDASLESLKDLQ
jgi:Flp pilus assembly protein TadB